MCKVTLKRVRTTTVAVEKQCVTYSKCVFVVIHHAMRMRHSVTTGVSGSTMIFHNV